MSTAASPAGNAIVVTFFVLGHILGAILMGLALRQHRHRWLAGDAADHADACPRLRGSAVPALDMAAWLLMSLAFVCCAVKIVKTPNDQWDLPPLGQTP